MPSSLAMRTSGPLGRTGATCAVLVALASLAACATGKEPPAPTAMVEIHDDKPFIFGMGELGCGIPQDTTTCTKPDAKLPDSTPPMAVKLKPFAIDIHEVTNEQYRYCVAAGICSLNAGDNGPPGIVDSYYPAEKYKNFPVIMLHWKQAAEYCAFVGKRLPTEFEWERVAGGPAQSPQEKRVYPWSKKLGYEPPLQTCPDVDVNIRRCNSGLNSTRAVMSSKDDVVDTGSGKVYDLAGNVAEFTASDYVRELGCDASQPYTCGDCVTCLNLNKKIDLCESICKPCACGQGSPATKPGCYQPCQTPICPRFPANAAPYDGSYTGKNTVTQRTVRGGSYFAENESWQECDGRSDNRRLAQKPDDQPQTWIGFRCAKDL